MKNRTPLFQLGIGLASNVVTAGFLFALTKVFDVIPVPIAISIGVTFMVTSSLFVGIWIYIRSRNRFGSLGITGFWSDAEHFQRDRGMSYGEFCLQFVSRTPHGHTIRMLGYDWAELLSDTPILGDHVFPARLNFQVMLVDPKSPTVIEKRLWEMTWQNPDGAPVYPEGIATDSALRLRKKIENCVGNARIFEGERPEVFSLKLTQTFPSFAVLMNDEMAIGVLYTLPHKGKDTIIFEARRLQNKGQLSQIERIFGTGLYGWLGAYFQAVWADPTWRHIHVTGARP